MQNKRPSFDCFHKIISIEGKESVTITANNNSNEMSSLVAAASGRRGDGRPRALARATL
jgi:hypothetical protein